MIVFKITLCLTFLYTLFLFWSLYNWKKIRDKSNINIDAKNVKVAVVIPIRNEEMNLPLLFKSLAIQDYPKENFQIIISDDHSTDLSMEIAEKFFLENNFLNGLCLRSPKQSKKEALSFAISKTEAELILTTDADTFMGKGWISAMVTEYSNSGVLMICGPVKLRGENNFMDKLQVAEFIGLSAIGASGINAQLPMFCNGANLAFPRKIFYESGGYEKSLSFSGDDTQLMLKIHKTHPGKISFLKDSRAVVKTNVVKGKSDFLQQRRRWASKIPMTLSPFAVFSKTVGININLFIYEQYIFFIV